MVCECAHRVDTNKHSLWDHLFQNRNSPSAATMKSKKLTSPTFEAGLFGCTPSTRYPHFPALSRPCAFPIAPPSPSRRVCCYFTRPSPATDPMDRSEEHLWLHRQTKHPLSLRSLICPPSSTYSLCSRLFASFVGAVP